MSDKTIPVVLKRRPNCTMCGQPYDATGRLLALETERDQFAASCDIFRGRIQALELERDALRTKVAELAQLTLDQQHFNARLIAEAEQLEMDRDGRRCGLCGCRGHECACAP